MYFTHKSSFRFDQGAVLPVHLVVKAWVAGDEELFRSSMCMWYWSWWQLCLLWQWWWYHHRKHCKGSGRCHLSSTAGLTWLRSSHTRGLLQGIASDFVLTQLLIISTYSDFGAWCKRKRKGAARIVSEEGARFMHMFTFASGKSQPWGYIFSPLLTLAGDIFFSPLSISKGPC